MIVTTTTKRTIVDMAYEECALAGYEFDVTPEETLTALRRLDSLMAAWQAQSIYIGYNFPPALGEGDLDDPSGIPDVFLDIVVMSLAMRIAPRMGKTISAETRTELAKQMSSLRAQTAIIPERPLARGTPAGSGRRQWWQ